MKTILTDLIKRSIAALILILISPLLVIFYVIVKLSSKGPFIFKQKRLGRNKKLFNLYKIRTMVNGAENLKKKYSCLNEADGPVFKIRHDPRYTTAGKFLSHTGLDELPQLINIIKGEMNFIGPRPLPLEEAMKVPKMYQKRFSVLPGITSLWVTNGAHKLTFQQWMKSDIDYVTKKNFFYDLHIGLKTILLIIKALYN